MDVLRGDVMGPFPVEREVAAAGADEAARGLTPLTFGTEGALAGVLPCKGEEDDVDEVGAGAVVGWLGSSAVRLFFVVVGFSGLIVMRDGIDLD